MKRNLFKVLVTKNGKETVREEKGFTTRRSAEQYQCPEEARDPDSSDLYEYDIFEYEEFYLSGHSIGNWFTVSGGDAGYWEVRCHVRGRGMVHICDTQFSQAKFVDGIKDEDEIKANVRVLKGAGDMINTLVEVYVELLRGTIHNHILRAGLNDQLCMLRSRIASTLDMEPEEVQNACEQEARERLEKMSV